MNGRLLGAILLIAGTTVGAAMLALPVTAGLGGFIPSLCIMLLIWLFMMLTAFYILEVTLRFKKETNLISMMQLTLGKKGEVVAWIVYLLLLYALVSAYMVGGTQILSQTFALPSHFKDLWPLIQFVVFGAFIYFGVYKMDVLNRLLMLGLFVGYLGMLFLAMGKVSIGSLSFIAFDKLLPAVSVTLTSFGYHIIIPTLTNYLNHDVKQLKKAIFFGSLIPFVIYLLWQFLVLGIIPAIGTESLMQAKEQHIPVISYLSMYVKNPWLVIFSRVFAFFAILTSLLGVLLSLSDFLFDGLKLKKTPRGKMIVILLTFIPPLVFSLFYPKGFILALNYAGICVVILLGLMPALMVYFERYRRNEKRRWVKAPFKVFGGKPLVLLTLVVSFVLLLFEVFS